MNCCIPLEIVRYPDPVTSEFGHERTVGAIADLPVCVSLATPRKAWKIRALAPAGNCYLDKDGAPFRLSATCLSLGAIKGPEMKVLNVHERELQAGPDQVGALVDSLASRADGLWPKHAWPRMEFDRPLGVGASGGHGPIRYFVEDYLPGESIKFRFTRPKGFDGFHGYERIKTAADTVVLRHTLEMTTRGLAVLSWQAVYRPLHDALIEDSLATAEASLGKAPQVQPWSLWVRFLRRVVSRGKARAQVTPNQRLQGTPASGRP